MLANRSTLPGATDTRPGWKRELYEWLLAVAALLGGVWISRTIGQVIIDVIFAIGRAS